jgi:hypothetical protein
VSDRRWYEEDATIVIDVHYDDGRVKRGISLSRLLEVGEQLDRGEWVVEQVVPSPEKGVDFEAYLRKVRAGEVPAPILDYLVIKVSDEGEVSSESHRVIGLLVPGDIILSGVERWRVTRVKDRGGHVLFDGVVIVAPAPWS